MKTLLTSLTLLLLAAPTAYAADLAVFPPSSVNLEAGQGDAIGAVLAAALQAENVGEVVGPVDAAEALEAAQGESRTARAAAAARTLGVSRYVLLSAVRLDKKISLRGKLVWTDGSRTNRAEMVAAGLDDMEPAAKRLAKALLTGRTTKETVHHSNVTRREAAKRNRVFSERIVGVRTGIIKPFAGGEDFQTQATLHFDLRLEAETYFLEFGGGFVFPTGDGDDDKSAYGSAFGRIGGAFYLTDANTAPYVGGGVEPRIQIAADSGIGFAPYANLGLMFFRESSARLYVDLQVAQNLLEVDNHFESYDEDERSDDGHYPTEVGVLLGIGW